MNKLRRKNIQEVIDKLTSLQNDLESLESDVESIQDKEIEYRDNMPENLQGSERYEQADSACDSLETARDGLRDIAEQEAINRFTTAEINVDMSGMQNTVNSGDDIDGFMTKLTDSVNEAVDNMTEA